MKDTCNRCGREGHKATYCRVAFGKAFPGRCAAKVHVRFLTWSMQVEYPLTEGQADRLKSLLEAFHAEASAARVECQGGV